MNSLFLRTCLKVSAKGGFPRYFVESLITPTFYALNKRQQPWEELVLDLIKYSKSPKQTLEHMERNVRFRSAARKRYLAHHFMSPSNAVDLFGEKAPTMKQVLEVFPEISKFKLGGDEDSKRKELVHYAKQVQYGKQLSHWTLEDVLESCGCCVYGTSAFNAFCEFEGVYELFTDEYVTALAHHLKGKKLILEVGAGSGRLAHLLRQKMSHRTQIVATDSGGWRKMRGLKPVNYPVDQIPYDQALEKYKPDAVLSSWMPMGSDWTEKFRAQSSVVEYVLIGEPGCVGKTWESWGEFSSQYKVKPEASFLPEHMPEDTWTIDVFEWLGKGSLNIFDDPTPAAQVDKPVMQVEQPPYHPFTKQVLPFSKLQISRYDRALRGGNSKTTSFTGN